MTGLKSGSSEAASAPRLPQERRSRRDPSPSEAKPIAVEPPHGKPTHHRQQAGSYGATLHHPTNFEYTGYFVYFVYTANWLQSPHWTTKHHIKAQ